MSIPRAKANLKHAPSIRMRCTTLVSPNTALHSPKTIVTALNNANGAVIKSMYLSLKEDPFAAVTVQRRTQT